MQNIEMSCDLDRAHRRSNVISNVIILNVNIRIVIQILSLHWMMKNISYFNVSEKPKDIKLANVFHHPVQA